MKARDVQAGMTIKATPFMGEPVEGLVEKTEAKSNSGGCVVTFHLKGYQEAFSFRGSSNIKVIKNVIK